MMKFDEKVLQIEMQLNDTEAEIVDYIRKHRKEVANMSIQNLSKDLYVAPNAIMRLAKKLGYTGFAELKFSLQTDLKSESNTTINKEIPPSVIKTLDIIDNTLLEKAANMILKGNNTIVIGVGDNVYFCEILAQCLRCIDKNVQSFQHIYDMAYAGSHAKKNDTIIVISARGENERLNIAALEGKKHGANVISVTHLCDNALAKESTLNLYFWGEYCQKNGYNATDRTGLMILLKMLMNRIWESC